MSLVFIKVPPQFTDISENAKNNILKTILLKIGRNSLGEIKKIFTVEI